MQQGRFGGKPGKMNAKDMMSRFAATPLRLKSGSSAASPPARAGAPPQKRQGPDRPAASVSVAKPAAPPSEEGQRAKPAPKPAQTTGGRRPPQAAPQPSRPASPPRPPPHGRTSPVRERAALDPQARKSKDVELETALLGGASPRPLSPDLDSPPLGVRAIARAGLENSSLVRSKAASPVRASPVAAKNPLASSQLVMQQEYPSWAPGVSSASFKGVLPSVEVARAVSARALTVPLPQSCVNRLAQTADELAHSVAYKGTVNGRLWSRVLHAMSHPIAPPLASTKGVPLASQETLIAQVNALCTMAEKLSEAESLLVGTPHAICSPSGGGGTPTGAKRRVRFCTFDLSVVEAVPADIAVRDLDDVRSTSDEEDEDESGTDQEEHVPDTETERLAWKVEEVIHAAHSLRKITRCPCALSFSDSDASIACACGDLRTASKDGTDLSPAHREAAQCALGSALALFARVAVCSSEAEADAVAPRPPKRQPQSNGRRLSLDRAGADAFAWTVQQRAAKYLCAELASLRVREGALPLQRRLSDLLSSVLRLHMRRALNPHCPPPHMMLSNLLMHLPAEQAEILSNAGGDVLSSLGEVLGLETASVASAGSIQEVGGIGRGGGGDESGHLTIRSSTGTLKYNAEDLAALVHRALDSICRLRPLVEHVIAPLVLKVAPASEAHKGSSSFESRKVADHDSDGHESIAKHIKNATPEEVVQCYEFAEAHEFLQQLWAMPGVIDAATGNGHAWRRLREFAAMAELWKCAGEAHLVPLSKPLRFRSMLEAEAVGVRRVRTAAQKQCRKFAAQLSRLRHKWRKGKGKKQAAAAAAAVAATAGVDSMVVPPVEEGSPADVDEDGFPLMSPPLAPFAKLFGSPTNTKSRSRLLQAATASEHADSHLSSSMLSTASEGDPATKAVRHAQLIAAADVLEDEDLFEYPVLDIMTNEDEWSEVGMEDDDDRGEMEPDEQEQMSWPGVSAVANGTSSSDSSDDEDDGDDEGRGATFHFSVSHRPNGAPVATDSSTEGFQEFMQFMMAAPSSDGPRAPKRSRQQQEEEEEILARDSDSDDDDDDRDALAVVVSPAKRSKTGDRPSAASMAFLAFEQSGKRHRGRN
jgi:hypothetical protein